MNLLIRPFEFSFTKKPLMITIVFVAILLVVHLPAVFGETVQVPLTIRAEVKNVSKLELDSTTILFELGGVNPDVAPIIESASSQITVQCKARAGANTDVSLTILAGGDLISGSDVILINNINWIASGNGFINGTMDKTFPQTMGGWKGGGVYTGQISFRLINRWEYSSGDYLTTALLTLVVP